MRTRFGIKGKFLLWYLGLLMIFYATLLILFFHIHRMTKLSDEIANMRYRVSSLTSQLIESLLAMEESEKKYRLLKKREYADSFSLAHRAFERDLEELVLIEPDPEHREVWGEISAYRLAFLKSTPSVLEEDALREISWIPEVITNEWLKMISRVRLEDERWVEKEVLGLYQQGVTAFRWGMLGLVGSALIGLAGLVLLAYAINRPLRELQRGIKSLMSGSQGLPIRVRTRDELGDVAAAFNEMSSRLQEEERMRSDFIAMLSHEIRTPLTSIRESVSLIEEEVTGAVNERQRRLLGIAQKEIERLTTLLQNLMQVSRMEAGVLEVKAKSVPAARIVEACVQRLAPAAEAKGVRLKTQVSQAAGMIMGSPDLLEQVLLNLMGNAIKFSPRGGEVIVHSEADSGGSGVTFSVSDMGPGIPLDEQALVFHKYYRVSGTEGRVDGMGLGLSISKHIVEAHGGNIWVESAQGRGSTFRFTVPRARARG
jgi:signal transduction histidine kinase